MRHVGSFLSGLYLLLFNLTYPVLWFSSLKTFQLLYWVMGKEFPRNYTDRWATGWGLGQKAGAFFFSRTKVTMTIDPKAQEYDGPFLVIMNHQATFDIGMAFYILWALKRHIRWVLKKELLNAPIVGRACRETRCAFIDRKDRAQATAEFQRFAEQLKEDNASAVIFVEGTRATPKKLESSDFQNLLNPRPLGFTMLREALPDWPVLSITQHWHNKQGTTFFGTSIWRSTVQIDCTMHPADVSDDHAAWLIEEEWPRCDALITQWKEEATQE